MATMQDLIEQWKKEAAQSQTVTGPEIPNIAMYQAQNDVHRDYGAANSALAREVANQQMLSQPVIQMAPTGLDVTMQEKQDLVKARREAEALQAAQSIPSGTGIGSSLQMLPSMADYQSNAVSNRDGVLKYIADHPDEAEYVTRFLELNNGEMDGIKYKNYLKQQKDYELAQKWVDPNYKMSKEEEKYGEKLALDRYKVLSSKKNRTPEEDAELRTMDDLFMKTDEFSSFILNSADEAVKAVRGVKWLTDHGFMGPVQMLANKVTDPISNKLLGAYDEVDKTPIQNAQVQNPIASGAGRFATNAALYSATNPAFDAIAEASGLTGAGKFALNQAAQFGQDVALDTIPTYVDMTKDGSLSDAEKKELAKGALLNAGGNLVLGGLGEAFKGANRADIPEVDKTIKEATEQAENAQKRIQELARQNEEVLPALGDMTKGAEDIPYTVTKAEPELPKMETPKAETQKTATKAEIEELNNELSNMWGDNAAKETKSAAKTQRLDLPEEVTEKGASDFQEIYDSLESMRQVAEKSGNEKVVDKFNKLSKAVSDYENAFFKEESEETLTSAKKAADAARQSFIREVKKTNPNYTGELTGTKLGNAYRRTSMKAAEEANQELADSITEADNMLNTNRWAKDAAPETQKVFEGVKNVDPSTVKIREIPANSAHGVRYQVVSENGNLTTPLEGKKWYKTVDEANEAAYRIKNKVPGENPLQTFAEGDAKEQWKTSKMRTNSMEKSGQIKTPDDAPIKDYAYRVQSGNEQLDIFNDRYKDSQNVVSDLITKDQFDAADMRGSVHEWENLMNSDNLADIRKANRLGKKMAFEGREGGRTVQAIKEMNRNTPGGQLREAQETINQAIDKRVGKGTSEALDNLYEKISEAYDSAKNKEDFINKLGDLMNGDLKKHASKKTAKDMASKPIRGYNKIVKMIDNAESLEDVPFDELCDVMYKSNGGVALRAKTQYEVYNLLKQMEGLDPESYAYRKLEAQAARKVMAEVPSGLGDYVRAFLYDNMLGNFKTAFSRNFLGNLAYQSLENLREPISAGVDKLTSFATKQHSALGWNADKAKAYGQGFKKGATETGLDIANGVNTTRSGQRGWSQALKNNTTVHNDNKLLGHWLNQVDFYVENAMKGGDRPIYEAAYAKYRTELEQMLDRYGKNGVYGLANVDDADIPEVIDKLAQVRAADTVFQKQGHMSEGLTKLRDGLGDLSRGALGVDILSTASSPFTLTPGNMAERALEYTPLGAVKNAVETGIELHNGNFNQRRFVDEAGRTILGLPVLGGAYLGAKKGLINGGYSTDPDEKAAQQEDGFIEYGLNVPESIPVLGGKTLDTSDLPVYGPFMQAGSVMAEDGITPASALQAAEAVMGGSTTQGIRRAFGADSGSYSSQNSLVDNLTNTVKSSGSQFVPSLVRQTAQTVDPYKRDLGEYGTDEYYKNLVINNIPGLRQQLPIKTNVEGQPILQNQGRDLGSKILENYVLPMNMSEYEPSRLNTEATRLKDETGEVTGYAPKAKRSDLRNWDEASAIEYSEEQYRDYKEDLGKLNSKMGNDMLDSKFYKEELDDKGRAAELGKAYSAMKLIAKENATGEEPDDEIVKVFKEKGTEGVINHLAGKKFIKDVDLSSSSTFADEVMEAAMNGDYEEAKTIAKNGKITTDILKANDLTMGSNAGKEVREAVFSGNVKKAEKIGANAAKTNEILKKYGLTLGSNAGEAIKEAVDHGNLQRAENLGKEAVAEKKEKEAKEKLQDDLSSYGLTKPGPAATYQKIKSEIPGITTQQFASTYKAIDSDGNQGIKQTELLDYLNNYVTSDTEAQKIWSAYGGWKNKNGETKKLVKKNGKWTATY